MIDAHQDSPIMFKRNSNEHHSRSTWLNNHRRSTLVAITLIQALIVNNNNLFILVKFKVAAKGEGEDRAEANGEVKAEFKVTQYLGNLPNYLPVPLPNYPTPRLFHLLVQPHLILVLRMLHPKLIQVLFQPHLKLVPGPLQLRESGTMRT
jgi:hypothetical protein